MSETNVDEVLTIEAHTQITITRFIYATGFRYKKINY